MGHGAAPLKISIHAPLTGSDRSGWEFGQPDTYFNPRSPYGERRPATSILCPWRISIHAPLTGSDQYQFQPQKE